MHATFLPHPLEIRQSFIAGPKLESETVTGKLIGRSRCYGIYAFPMPAHWVSPRWTKPVVVNYYVHKGSDV